MVHEGQALSGHYWTYVRIDGSEIGGWLKFNDILVTPCSWEEVRRFSEGGYGTASAYCLIYVNRSGLLQAAPDSGAGTASSASLGESLQ